MRFFSNTLAGQTVIYGLSSIISWFLNYLITPILTYYFTPADNGKISLIYSLISFLNIIFNFNTETIYFRYNSVYKEEIVFKHTLALSFGGGALFYVSFYCF